MSLITSTKHLRTEDLTPSLRLEMAAVDMDRRLLRSPSLNAYAYGPHSTSHPQVRKYTLTGEFKDIDVFSKKVKVYQTVLLIDIKANDPGVLEEMKASLSGERFFISGDMILAGTHGPWIRKEHNWSHADASFADSRVAVVQGKIKGEVIYTTDGSDSLVGLVPSPGQEKGMIKVPLDPDILAVLIR